MTASEVLYVRPGWLIMREHDRRALVAYPGRHDAIQHAMTEADGKLEIVVLNDSGKVTKTVTVELPA